MHPDYLRSPDSVVGNIIRSLGQIESSSIHDGRLEVEGEVHRSKFRQDGGCLIAFTWSASGRNLPDERSGKGAKASWASCRLESGLLTDDNAAEMIYMLVDSGIVIKTADLFLDIRYGTLYFPSLLCRKPDEKNYFLLSLPRVNKLIMGPAAVYSFFSNLKRPISGGLDRDDMFLCPYLTQLELLNPVSKDETLRYIRELITERQKERPKTRNPAKLKRVGLPFRIRDDCFSDPVFEGIEFYLVS